MIASQRATVEQERKGRITSAESQPVRQPAKRTDDSGVLALQRAAGNRTVEELLNAGSEKALSSGSGAHIQRKTLTKEELQKRYGIKLEAGDKEWSESDVAHLSWALSKLSPREAAALKGYRFLRWQDRESRNEADPSYDRRGEEEAGLHEADLKQDSYKISLYDAAFDNSTTMALETGGKVIGKPQPISRINLLHEIGHALAFADVRSVWNAYRPAKAEYDQLVERFNRSDTSSQQKKLKPLVARKGTEVDDLGRKLQAPEGRALAEFEELSKGMAPLTEHAKTNTNEAFAETFALYKLNPEGIKRLNPKLAAWFKRQGYLSKGR